MKLKPRCKHCNATKDIRDVPEEEIDRLLEQCDDKDLTFDFEGETAVIDCYTCATCEESFRIELAESDILHL